MGARVCLLLISKINAVESKSFPLSVCVRVSVYSMSKMLRRKLVQAAKETRK